jgi:hypothetical protein
MPRSRSPQLSASGFELTDVQGSKLGSQRHYLQLNASQRSALALYGHLIGYINVIIFIFAVIGVEGSASTW